MTCQFFNYDDAGSWLPGGCFNRASPAFIDQLASVGRAQRLALATLQRVKGWSGWPSILNRKLKSLTVEDFTAT